ncbi:MAG TPA: hypothetical protein VG711_04475, partial [Phycisphaerales bacterium]|nr:hypothetical protein [Phycisphaerales bacterium]
VTVVDPQDLAVAQGPQISDIWLVNVDGTGRTQLTNGECANYQPVWAPDGTVYFVSNRGGNDNIWAANTGRSTFMAQQPTMQRTMTSVDPDSAAPSSDGRH